MSCQVPFAANFDASSTVEDYSCLYLLKNQGNCHLFKDLTEVVDRSFTLSYSVEGKNWVFFHDYFPDMYLHTHQFLYNVYANSLYKHHEGAPGNYYGTANPFFIDITFTPEIRRTIGRTSSDDFRETGDMLLESVQWVTEFINGTTEQRYQTLTHISIWNSYQHTGRIPIADVFKDLQYENKRRTQGSWTFNNFRDLLGQEGPQFLQDIFHNYTLDPAALPLKPLAWYDKKAIEDSYFTIRFEFDNTSGKSLIVHDMVIQALKTSR